MSALLVICDMQRAVDDARLGRRGQPDAEDAVARLLDHWRERGLSLVHLRAEPLDPDAADAPGSAGHDWLAKARPRDGETVIDHRGHNAFIGTDLMSVLEETGAHEIVVCGAALTGTVESTLRMAHALGFMAFVPADAVIAREVAARDGRRWDADEVAAQALARIDGTFGQVVTVDALTAGESAAAH